MSTTWGAPGLEFEQRLQGVDYATIAAQGGGIASTCAPAGLAPVGGRRHHAGGQIRLRAGPAQRTQDAAGGAAPGPDAAADGAGHVSGRARLAARVRGARRRLHRRSRAPHAAGAGRRRAGRCGRRVLRASGVLARTSRARVQGRGASGPAGQAACRATFFLAWGHAGGALRRSVGGPPGIPHGKRRGGDGRSRHGGRAVAGRFLRFA
ncbi:hypothetical protein G6F22_017767 [Rhizopus arrhizus]|nr:hypothetical protein G6F22_017767 [Rhizopus arrhizus]